MEPWPLLYLWADKTKKNVCILICQASSFLALPWSKLQRKYTINKPREYCLWVCVYISSHELMYKHSRLRMPLELWYRWCFQLWWDGHHSLKFWHLWTEPQWVQCWNWYWLTSVKFKCLGDPKWRERRNPKERSASIFIRDWHSLVQKWLHWCLLFPPGTFMPVSLVENGCLRRQ